MEPKTIGILNHQVATIVFDLLAHLGKFLGNLCGTTLGFGRVGEIVMQFAGGIAKHRAALLGVIANGEH